MNDSKVFCYKKLFPKTFPILDELRKSGILCDVILITDHCRIFAHKVVLAATTPYFYKLFVSPDKSTKSEVHVKDIDSDILKDLINFVYTGCIKITFSNFQPLMIGASLLKLYQIRDACAQFLIERLHPTNVIEIRQFGKKMNCDYLVSACETHIDDNFAEVSMSKEFVRILSSEDLVNIFKRDELYVVSEEIVFEAAMRWVHHDTLVRAPMLPKLLANVRLPLLTPQYLTDRVSTNHLIKQSHTCRDLLDEARDFHLMPERFIFGPRTKPRRRVKTRDTILKVVYPCLFIGIIIVEYTFSVLSNIESIFFSTGISHWWGNLSYVFEDLFISDHFTIHLGILFIMLATYFAWKHSEIKDAEGKKSITENLVKFIQPAGDMKPIENYTNYEEYTNHVVGLCEQANVAMKWMLSIVKYEYKSL